MNTSSAAETKQEEKGNGSGPIASVSDTLGFGSSPRVRLYRFLGFIAAAASGVVYPAMAFYWAKTFEDLGAVTDADTYMRQIRTMAYTFMILGVISFVSLCSQGFLFEMAASKAMYELKTQWFEALLRQDMAYFDIKDVSGQASIVSSNANKFKKGVGRKLGEGLQFTITAVGGIAYGFYSSWRTSLLLFAVLPLMAGSGFFVQKVNTTMSERSSKNYGDAGGIVYSTVSSIKTILSLNACQTFINKFETATEKAYRSASKFFVWVGLGNGLMMASFLVSYIVITLYGSFLLYKDLRKTGCDPSGIIDDNEACGVTGTQVFGALLGISFGAMGLPQISAAVEAFTQARSACYPAVEAINRKVGSQTDDDKKDDIEMQADSEMPAKREDIPLPKYLIDSSSTEGKKLKSVEGIITFKEVSFAYPTRPETLVFDGLSLNIEAGKTVALVGASGCGKSTTIQLIERFYDPTAGSVLLDGTDVRECNVGWLRSQIGLVGQEPTLFARTIKENISYGCPDATQEEIETAAKAANAHDFISAFPDGYDTFVGDKGAQLSGGQKQRVAIARVLIQNPKILLLDEATSALDSESESMVQEALDGLVASSNRTTVVIAHRLSTIKNADVIAVVKNGRICETGTHTSLLKEKNSEYKKLVDAQSRPMASSMVSSNSDSDLAEFIDMNNESNETQINFKDVFFSYPSRPDNLVFKGLNLSVKKGEVLAVVGPSGGGKSTTIQLIERFYDPQSGVVEIDGVDLRTINVQWLRDQLGLVSQEPSLFNTTIRENISYGKPGATQQEIEDAAIKANAHDFICSFPSGYDTEVGETGAQVSGGQKQRIAIARALLKSPKILLLDEATSALDSESEGLVQETIDKLIASRSHTVVVIAHRLSTIRNADRIAVIKDGVVKELGNHGTLMKSPKGLYRKLVDLQSLDGSTSTKVASKKKELGSEEERTFEESESVHEDDSNEVKKRDKDIAKRAKLLAKGDYGLFFIGAIGAILTGLVFPGWGIIFAYMIELLYRQVLKCDNSTLDSIPGSFNSCQDYWDSEADKMKEFSINVTYAWLVIMSFTLIGNSLVFYGFGKATEKMNKRVRDKVFNALVRQDMAYFDTNTVGKISTQVEDDAAMMHSFSGEPIRSLVMSLASVLVGLIVSFIYMWPFALLTLGILPFMAFGAEMEMRMYFGEDEGVHKENENSPGGIVVETLLNIKTIASLAIEKLRLTEYSNALKEEETNPIRANIAKGAASGLGFFVQCWGMALMFWWGGYVLINYPDSFSYRDFLISMFSLLFSLSGLSVAMMGATNRDKAKAAANRIFKLIDTEGSIDPLSTKGKKGN
eukprot:CAMPEP_0184863396 /NCGR_PEP_ID=MMETSP0580-20130426/10902_1 /TAXON_ID=1118495 /ORGANISM="Dactyliosolen fragilissimus" /LENGTH=1328 /DNA_ID=CAMNT_0027361703 /DNA_START=81 /DNA_END=4067 /DNA_ORIENTATION=-